MIGDRVVCSSSGDRDLLGIDNEGNTDDLGSLVSKVPRWA